MHIDIKERMHETAQAYIHKIFTYFEYKLPSGWEQRHSAPFHIHHSLENNFLQRCRRFNKSNQQNHDDFITFKYFPFKSNGSFVVHQLYDDDCFVFMAQIAIKFIVSNVVRLTFEFQTKFR